jgi:hypothetical protein
VELRGAGRPKSVSVAVPLCSLATDTDFQNHLSFFPGSYR